MSKKLIFPDDHSGELICDNPKCDYQAPPGLHTFGPHLIGLPCPECGENLLTEIDYKNQMKLIKTVEWINWFGNLLGIGYETREEALASGDKLTSMSARSVHGEWKIDEDKENK